MEFISAQILQNELTFNRSVYESNMANKWKFLEKIPVVTNYEMGFLLQSPVPVFACTGAYVLFVCSIGPMIMRNREPFHLKNVIRFYNLMMVFLAAILVTRVHGAIGSLGSMVDCGTVFNLSDESGTKIYRMANFILSVRLSEYLDTIFFTLRKKQNQITFLHVFHHAFVPIYAFWILRTAPLRFNVYIILINSGIHVLMYFYYFLATFQERPESKTSGRATKPSFIMSIVQKLLMFKKYMTQLQILQFVTLAIYSLWAAVQPNHCGVPWTYIIANFLLAFGFLALFVHFYIRSYKASEAAVRSAKVR